MKIGITGYEGYIGKALLNAWSSSIPVEIDDISDQDMVRDVLRSHEYKDVEMLIHCAALTDVEVCELDIQRAFAVNAFGTGYLTAHFRGRYFIYLSTDHVFPGSWFLPKEKRVPDPRNNYGLSKAAGETMVGFFPGKSVIVRSSKVFSEEYLDSTLNLILGGHEVTVTTLIQRSFIHRHHFLIGMYRIVDRIDEMPDILHLAGTKRVSYYKFLRDIADALMVDRRLVVPRRFPVINAAPRPFRGGLNVNLAGKLDIPTYSYLDGIEVLKREMRYDSQ